MITTLDTFNLLDASDRAQALDKRFKFSIIVNHHYKIASEQTVVAVDVDAAQHEFFFFRYDVCQIVYNTDVIITNDAQRNGILRRAFARPLGTYNAIAKTFF